MTNHDDCDHSEGPYHPECPTCHGDGAVWAGYEDRRRCRDCDGTGQSPWVVCFECYLVLGARPEEDDLGRLPPLPRHAHHWVGGAQ